MQQWRERPSLRAFVLNRAFLGLVIRLSDRPALALAAAAALGGSLLVSYARARGEAAGVSVRGGLMQRAERLVLLGMASLLDPLAGLIPGWSGVSLLGGTVVVIAAGTLATSV